MLNDDLEIYGSCDLEKPSIPPRSHLYHLEPIGIGEPYVESLTSYIARLAEAHCLYPSSLVTKIISCELKQIFIKDYSSRNISSFFTKSRFINSHGKITQEIVKALKKLTLKQNLDRLTVLSYSEVLSSRKLFKKHKSWCPACYEQWRISKQTIYEPLLWTIAEAKICPHHYQLLQNTCPYCNQSIPWLTGKSRVGYCSYCDSWLGSFSQVSNDIVYDKAELAKYIWIVLNIGKLISFRYLASSLVQKDNIPKALNQIIDATYNGNISTFARAFGLPKNSVWMWCKNKSTPELRIILTICYCLDISLLDLITLKEKALKSPQINIQRLPSVALTQRTSPKTFDYETVENYLQTTLNSSDIPPLTMKEVAERLGVNRRTVSGYFPVLCKAISAKHRCYQKIRTKELIKDCCQEIEQAVLSIYQSGEYPSEARVSQLISQPGYFRYKEVRNFLKKAIISLKI